MSAPATSYKLFYPDTNTVTALDLFAGNGSALAPQSIADETSPPAGWKVKTIAFASAAEAVFATPTFQNPNAPVPVYLTYHDDVGGNDLNVLDGLPFATAAPGRPTPRGEHAINYTASVQENGQTWTIKTPDLFIPKVKQRTKDPITGATLYGNDFTLLWSGVLPDAIQVQCDVEDITDPAGFQDVAYTNATTYAESSVGMSLVRLNSEIIPQDGFIHALKFRIRYNCGGDVSPWVEGPWQQAMFAMPAPNAPTNVIATVLRDRADTIPDRVRVEWQWAATTPGDAVEIYAVDYTGKKHLIGEETDNAVTSITVENVSRFVTQVSGPAVQSAYRFGVLSKNRSSKSDLSVTAGTYLLTNKVKDTTPPTPDEIAGTAEDMSYSSLVIKLTDEIQASTAYTSEQKLVFSQMASAIMYTFITVVKRVIMRGGSVDMTDFGEFRAKWSNERWGRNPATGEPVLIPASRGLGFTPSKGFKVGTKYGVLLSDEQAKNYTPPNPPV